MKQWGLAVHHFSDANSGLPPSHLGSEKLSLFPILSPFYEQQATYDLLTEVSPVLSFRLCTKWGVYGGSTPWTEEIKKQTSSAPLYFCPSRRAGGARFYDPGIATSLAGPLGDFSVVFCGRYDRPHILGRAAPETNADGAWSSHLNSPSTSDGPFRLPIIQYPAGVDATQVNNQFLSWTPRDTMAWWADGSSNQTLIGEKYIPQDVFEKCDTKLEMPLFNISGTAFGSSQNRKVKIDCTVWSLHDTSATFGSPARNRAANFSDTAGMILARGPAQYTTSPAGGTMDDWPSMFFCFGSWHPGICHFVLGDGSVRAFNVMTDPYILVKFACVDDGNPTESPK